MSDRSQTHLTDGATCPSLIYASTALFPPRDVLLDIVRVAERANTDHGLSGMLLYSGTRYVQLLEGPEDALGRIWRNLVRDCRHSLLWTVRPAPAPRRIPARLPMGYAGGTQMRNCAARDICAQAATAPDAAAAARLADEIARIARQIYPVTCAAERVG